MKRLLDMDTGRTVLVGELQPGGAWLITELAVGKLDQSHNATWSVDPRTERWVVPGSSRTYERRFFDTWPKGW